MAILMVGLRSYVVESRVHVSPGKYLLSLHSQEKVVKRRLISGMIGQDGGQVGSPELSAVF